MDWTRAKTILIVVFLMANIFLAYEYFRLNPLGMAEISSEHINEALLQLQKENVTVNAVIPNRVIMMPNIKVKYKTFVKEDIIRAFFSGKTPQVIETKDSLRIEDDNILVQVKDKELSYYNKKNSIKQIQISEEKSYAAAEDFLNGLGIFSGNIDIETKAAKNGYLLISGVQKYKNLFVDGTHVEIKSNEQGIIEGKILWFGEIEPYDADKEVISSLKALQKAAKKFKEENKYVNISEIKQGYYFGIKDMEQFNIKRIEEGTAVPVWRIKSDKDTLFVNAYNGQIEK